MNNKQDMPILKEIFTKDPIHGDRIYQNNVHVHKT